MNPFAALLTREVSPYARLTPGQSTEDLRHIHARSKNPWGLTPGEAVVLTQQRRSGSQKATAAALRLAPDTVRVHIYNAKKKMGLVTGLLAVIEWDQFMRS